MHTLAAAKRAAGFPPDSSRWSKERVIECIQDLHVKRTPLTPVSRHDPRLVSAAKRYFGSWANALVAAGVLRDKPRQNRKKSLRSTARRYFGGFPQAVRAAGLEPRRRRGKKRTADQRESETVSRLGRHVVAHLATRVETVLPGGQGASRAWELTRDRHCFKSQTEVCAGKAAGPQNNK